MLRLRFSTLLLFLLPALTVLLLVGIFNGVMLNQFSSSQTANQQIVKQTVHDLRKTMQFIDQVGTQYRNLSDLLITTDKHQLTQAQAYRIQSLLVDDLAQIESELDLVKSRLKQQQLDDFDLNQWHEKFINFKNFSIMASNIVVIDADTARNYISAAQKEYFQFVDQSNKLSNILSDYTDETFVQNQHNFQNSLNTMFYWGAFGLLIALFIAVFSASRLSNYLRTIMISLRDLASYRNDIPKLPELHRMLKNTKGELHQLAKAVYKFKKTLELNKQEEEQIFQLAFYDELTKLPNMQMLKKELHSHLLAAKKNQTQGVLIKFNINGFKVFNNALGYDFGDQLLREIANRLGQCELEDSLIFRGSSDEFFVLIEPLDQAEQPFLENLPWFGQRIQMLFSEPLMIDNEQLTITLSQGIVSFPKNENETSQEIIRNAMIAMHNAKALGNNRYVVYHQSLSLEVTEQFNLLKDLEAALDNNELTFYLQAQIHPKNKIPRAEALIRWNHPTRGWIRPDIFVALAEESNLILKLDRWMLTQVCTFISEQAQRGIKMCISINLSGHHFAHPHFLDHVEQIFEQTGVNPLQVTLELTENVFLNDFNDVVKKMEYLKNLGAHFSIDDFGTGYSSLNYLKRLPVNEIKVDQAFIRNITTNKEDWTLVKAVFEMAQTFNLDVVVEGVETAEQEAIIKRFGSAIIQGYLYAKPIPHTEWLEQLSEPINERQ